MPCSSRTLQRFSWALSHQTRMLRGRNSASNHRLSGSSQTDHIQVHTGIQVTNPRACAYLVCIEDILDCGVGLARLDFLETTGITLQMSLPFLRSAVLVLLPQLYVKAGLPTEPCLLPDLPR